MLFRGVKLFYAIECPHGVPVALACEAKKLHKKLPVDFEMYAHYSGHPFSHRGSNIIQYSFTVWFFAFQYFPISFLLAATLCCRKREAA